MERGGVFFLSFSSFTKFQEGKYNGFYGALAQKLCEYSHSHRVTFQALRCAAL